MDTRKTLTCVSMSWKVSLAWAVMVLVVVTVSRAFSQMSAAPTTPATNHDHATILSARTGHGARRGSVTLWSTVPL